MNKNIYCFILAIITFINFNFLNMFAKLYDPENYENISPGSSDGYQEKLKYKVQVTSMLIPVYATDNKGNPVHDLKKEDFVLKINGKKVQIDYLNRIIFGYDEKIKKRIKQNIKKIKELGKPLPSTGQDRIIFIVIDAIYNTPYGLKRAKKITGELINKATPGDLFVLMEINQYGGLKKIVGPSKNIEVLKKGIKKIAKRPAVMPEPAPGDSSMKSLSNNNIIFRREKRKQKRILVKYFFDFISQFEYILESITLPKMIFLISEGIPEILFFETNPNVKNSLFYNPELYIRLKKMTKSINKGGGLFYTINPGRIKLTHDKIIRQGGGKGSGGYIGGGFTLDDLDLPFVKESGVASLKTIATSSGGRYFEGSVERIVSKIKKITSSYYELTFTPGSEPGKLIKIGLKCLRKGVHIDTIEHTKARESYAEMNNIQKKIFALNIAFGRDWAITGKDVEKAAFTPLRKGQDNNETFKKIEIKSNMRMQDRKVDMFLIRLNNKFQNAKITFSKDVFQKIITLKFRKVNKNDILFFVIIDPKTNYCIYNRIQ